MTLRRSECFALESPGVLLIFQILLLIICSGYGYEPQDEFNYIYQDGYNHPSSNYAPVYNKPHPSPPVAVSPQYQQETKVYTSISYRELNTSYHCGVIPDTNYELYRKSSDAYSVADVTPYGKFPWIALILYKNKVICQGTLVHANLILTSSNCIPEYRSLEYYEIRLGDWDLLTDYNEYESYADREMRICSRHSVSKSNNNYGSYNEENYNDLIILKVDYRSNFDKLPQVKPLCLPKVNSYGYDNSYSGHGYSESSYSTCWIAGWYGSEVTKLDNHPQPQSVKDNSYGYTSNSNSGGSSYYQKYYKGYDESMIQKRAKVQQVKCQHNDNKYDYSGDYSVCFTGVKGYDACVAEKGAGIFCLVEEKEGYGNYDSGYNNYNKDYSSGYNNYNKDYSSGYNNYNKDYSSGSNNYNKDYSSGYNNYNKDYSSGSNNYNKDYSSGSNNYNKDYSSGSNNYNKDYSSGSNNYNKDYSSGYNNYNKDYSSDSNNYKQDYSSNSYGSGYDKVESNLHPEYKEAKGYYQQKEIKANPSESKPSRYRAVLYAVIQTPSKCRKGYDSYGKSYNRKSQPVVATKVDYSTVDKIMDIFWTHGYDESCPSCKAKYIPSYKSNYYFNYYNDNGPRTPSQYEKDY